VSSNIEYKLYINLEHIQLFYRLNQPIHWINSSWTN